MMPSFRLSYSLREISLTCTSKKVRRDGSSKRANRNANVSFMDDNYFDDFGTPYAAVAGFLRCVRLGFFLLCEVLIDVREL